MLGNESSAHETFVRTKVLGYDSSMNLSIYVGKFCSCTRTCVLFCLTFGNLLFS